MNLGWMDVMEMCDYFMGMRMHTTQKKVKDILKFSRIFFSAVS